MFYIPKIGGYLNILTNNEVKDFVAINFGEYLKSMRKKIVWNREEQNLRNVVQSLHVFLTTPNEVVKSQE